MMMEETALPLDLSRHGTPMTSKFKLLMRKLGNRSPSIHFILKCQTGKLFLARQMKRGILPGFRQTVQSV